MKKSDLISGKHIVETRIGDRFLVAGDFLPNIYGDGFTELTSYTEGLNRIDSFTGFCEYDICKVYEIVYRTGLPRLFEDSETVRLIWGRKPELSEVEMVILENADKTYKYIARDKNGSLFLYSKEMSKFAVEWCFDVDKGIDGNHSNFSLFNHLFKMVKWEDEEPTLISDLLEGKQ